MINLSKWWEAKEPEYAAAIADCRVLEEDLKAALRLTDDILYHASVIRKRAERRMPTDTGSVYVAIG